jgi:large repetitive protein
VFDQYETNVAVTTGSCGYFSATLEASITGAFQGDLDPTEITIDGYRGEWKIVGPEGVNYTIRKLMESTS